ncbi:adenosine kinase [Microvirga sp. 3-52]|jgi:sugar/nucleoside kinase (ribokinase family)|uniref:adenosine kinase n=1 Tax=Microvirga sp. 3-52 TaxID=2792425 RepID=UPI001AD5974A|nr:adenosine kinase [Microvirga sp. 3-52]MBO1906088.1 adenosine kinase [Microvirga sp. 3-52]MBS7453320.1 adenosine kinase [Microvirga sp. 3-52]
MSQTRIDVLTLGNAIVDVLAHTDEAFLIQKKVHKGAMQLIDEARAEELYGDMGPAIIVSGGSGANTAAGVASFGVKAGFIGKVKNDETGKLFAHDLKAIDVHYDVALAQDGPATARSFILVTPDGERTMNTYLGACQNLTPDDVNPDTVRASSIVYLEGYLWDPPAAKEAFRKAVRIAHEAGNKVALTLSDAFCVDRYRDEFLGLMRDGSLDILFANIHELQSLYGTSDADTALAAFREENVLGAITRSADGALIVSRGETRAVPAFPVERVVDTTGAGDLFASGFLAGLVKNLDLTDCARLGGLAAAEIISHLGARPQMNLREMAQQEGLLS